MSDTNNKQYYGIRGKGQINFTINDDGTRTIKIVFVPHDFDVPMDCYDIEATYERDVPLSYAVEDLIDIGSEKYMEALQEELWKRQDKQNKLIKE